MTDEQGVVRRRRTPAEIEQVVTEFEGSGLSRHRFCRQRGMALGTLNRYLKLKRESSRGASANLVAVELADVNAGGGGGLAVVLSCGRRIEVSAGFDASTLERLVLVLERT